MNPAPGPERGLKKVGIVGGISWLSTVEYYAGICGRAEQAHRAAGGSGIAPLPEMAIESLDLRHVLSLLGNDGDEGSWREFDRYHAEALKRLEASGADFALLAANTPHHRFAAITKGLSLPVLNLFEEVAEVASGLGPGDVLVLGTALTMRSPVLVEAFQRRGIRAEGPTKTSVREGTVQLIQDIHTGTSGDARSRLDALVAEELGAPPSRPSLICLACTELPLVLAPGNGALSFVDGGRTFLDTTQIHVAAAFRSASAGEPREASAGERPPFAPGNTRNGGQPETQNDGRREGQERGAGGFGH